MATERAWLDLGLRDVAASARLFWNAAALWGAGGENREEGEAQGSPCSAVGSLHHSEASLWGQFAQSAPDSPLAVNAHAPGSRDTHPSWALLKKSTPGPAMTPAFRLASASRCSQRLGCRRPAVGETLTTSECLAPPRPKVCRSGLLGASVLDMVARPPLNLAMVAGSRVGELGSGERSETEPLEGQWPDQAGLAGGLALPASESAKSSATMATPYHHFFFLNAASDSAEDLPIEDWVCAPYPALWEKSPCFHQPYASCLYKPLPPAGWHAWSKCQWVNQQRQSVKGRNLCLV